MPETVSAPPTMEYLQILWKEHWRKIELKTPGRFSLRATCEQFRASLALWTGTQSDTTAILRQNRSLTEMEARKRRSYTLKNENAIGNFTKSLLYYIWRSWSLCVWFIPLYRHEKWRKGLPMKYVLLESSSTMPSKTGCLYSPWSKSFKSVLSRLGR